MAELACVYDAAPVPRTPEDIISTPAQKRRKNKAQASQADRARQKPREPQARGKWLTASVTDDIPAVIRDAFEQARRRDPHFKRTWVVLLDGNRDQLKLVNKKTARKLGVKVTIVVNLIRVLEYLWKAAYAFPGMGEGSKDAEQWVAVAGRLDVAVAGRGEPGLGQICDATRATLSEPRRCERSSPVTKVPALSDRGVTRLHRSTTARSPPACPSPPASSRGPVQLLVKDRMDGTGARWSLVGAEAVLRLRALRASGDFDDYWAFHLERERERERIHHARYRDRLMSSQRNQLTSKKRTHIILRPCARTGR